MGVGTHTPKDRLPFEKVLHDHSRIVQRSWANHSRIGTRAKHPPHTEYGAARDDDDAPKQHQISSAAQSTKEVDWGREPNSAESPTLKDPRNQEGCGATPPLPLVAALLWRPPGTAAQASTPPSHTH